MIVIIAKGGKKRCGGIGDVLSGCIASSIVWSYEKGSVLACYATK
jgi:NAD(P)H-hydrate repair Nnr-like enzyme with NAD(P)H-hydrate dehydratase domain